MRIFLDTHILVYLAQSSLSSARIALLEESEQIFFSSISLWEIAKLVELKRIIIPETLESYLERFEQHSKLNCLMLEPKMLNKMVEIAPKMHKDPADQIIVASAITHKAKLMTNDKLIIKSKLVECL